MRLRVRLGSSPSSPENPAHLPPKHQGDDRQEQEDSTTNPATDHQAPDAGTPQKQRPHQRQNRGQPLVSLRFLQGLNSLLQGGIYQPDRVFTRA